MDVQQKINLAICRGFAEMGVEFAYPTRTVYLHQEGAEAGSGESGDDSEKGD